MNYSPVKLRVASVMGFSGVALGAFGAHFFKGYWIRTLDATEAAYRLGIWETAVFYHLVHAVAILVLAFGCPEKHQGKLATWCFVLGINIFSGTLYLLAITGMRWMGRIVLVGGILLLLGWLLLYFLRPSSKQSSPVK